MDLLDIDDMELESINGAVASVAASPLMKETLTGFSIPKFTHPSASESLTPLIPVHVPSTNTTNAPLTSLTPQPSLITTTASQPPAKRLKLGLSRPCPKF